MLYTSCFEVWGKLFKRELFDDIEFPVGKIHEDLYTLPKLVAKADKSVVYHKGLYNYRCRDDSIMANAARDYYYELIKCCIDGIKSSGSILRKKKKKKN